MFADNNSVEAGLSTGLKPLPIWDNLFAYYKVTSATGSYVMIYRRTGPPKQLGWGDSQSMRQPASVPPHAKPENLKKFPGQGSYDNLHLAAPMFIDPPPFLPANQQTNVKFAPTFKDIHMAPFCVHDCLHTHWRWLGNTDSLGAPITNPQQWGWSLEGKPYSILGAPMVPPNQEVTMTVNPAGFHYSADIADVPACAWQVVMHHGSGFSVAPNPEKDIEKIKSDIIGWVLTGSIPGIGRREAKIAGSTAWPLFYWRLRFAVLQPLPGPSTVEERNVFGDNPARLTFAENG